MSSIEPGQLWKYHSLGNPPGVVGRTGHWAVFMVIEAYVSFVIAQTVFISDDWPNQDELLRVRAWGLNTSTRSGLGADGIYEYERVA